MNEWFMQTNVPQKCCVYKMEERRRGGLTLKSRWGFICIRTNLDLWLPANSTLLTISSMMCWLTWIEPHFCRSAVVKGASFSHFVSSGTRSELKRVRKGLKTRPFRNRRRRKSLNTGRHKTGKVRNTQGSRTLTQLRTNIKNDQNQKVSKYLAK